MDNTAHTILDDAREIGQWEEMLRFKQRVYANDIELWALLTRATNVLRQTQVALTADIARELAARQFPLTTRISSAKEPKDSLSMLVKKMEALLKLDLPEDDRVLSDAAIKLNELAAHIKHYQYDKAPHISALIERHKYTTAYFTALAWQD